MASRLRGGLGEIEGVRVLDRGRELCGIVTAWVEGWDPDQLVRALRDRRINASSQIRIFALIDYEDKGVPGALRMSPHYYNTEEEIDEVTAAIRELARRRS